MFSHSSTFPHCQSTDAISSPGGRKREEQFAVIDGWGILGEAQPLEMKNEACAQVTKTAVPLSATRRRLQDGASFYRLLC